MITAWKVTRDFTETDDPRGIAVDVRGPRRAPDEAFEFEAGDAGVEAFRCYDDDGILYYEGIMRLGPEGTGFEPLDDYAMPNAGATSIRHQTIPV
jgi:hypothetical protein